MGINVSYRSDLDCGEDHTGGSCPKNHTVQAEWSRSSDYCRIIVDGEEMNMTVRLFDELADAMKVVRE